jgi:hypothetical protein
MLLAILGPGCSSPGARSGRVRGDDDDRDVVTAGRAGGTIDSERSHCQHRRYANNELIHRLQIAPALPADPRRPEPV